MKIIVVGDLYFLGAQLGYLLEENPDNEVLYLDKYSRKAASLKLRGQIIAADLDNDYGVRAAFAMFRPDVAFFLSTVDLDAGGGYNALKDYHKFMSSVLAFSECVSSFKVKKVYFRSSYEVYGLTKEQVGRKSPVLLHEKMVCTPTSYFGAKIKAAEDLLRIHCLMSGATFTALRLFEVFGNDVADNPAGLVQQIVVSLVKGKMIWVPGEHRYLDFISSDDAVKAFIGAIENNVVGPMNVGFGKGVKLSKVAYEVAKKLDKKKNILKVKERDFYPHAVSGNKILSTIYTPSKNIVDGVDDLISFYSESINAR